MIDVLIKNQPQVPFAVSRSLKYLRHPGCSSQPDVILPGRMVNMVTRAVGPFREQRTSRTWST